MTKKELIIKLLLTLFLTMITTLFIIFFRPKKASSAFLDDWFWVNKTHYSNNNSILFIGDSRTYRGISPTEIEKILPNQKVVNLGYSSGGLNKEALDFIIKKMDTICENPIIVFGFSPYSLTIEARKNEHLHQELNRTIADKIETQYINPHLVYFEPIKLTDYSRKNTSNYFQEFHNNGWAESYKVPEDNKEALPAYEVALSKTKLSEKSIKEVLDFVKFNTKKGIKIYGYRPPSTKDMELLENKFLSFNEVNLRNSFEDNGGKWIEIPNRYSYHSYDGSHLHFESAKKLSSFLAKSIKE